MGLFDDKKHKSTLLVFNTVNGKWYNGNEKITDKKIIDFLNEQLYHKNINYKDDEVYLKMDIKELDNAKDTSFSYYADIRVEMPDDDAICLDDAVEIAQEYVDLLTEQEENRYYNIFVKSINKKI